jgi:hypothetical protein
MSKSPKEIIETSSQQKQIEEIESCIKSLFVLYDKHFLARFERLQVENKKLTLNKNLHKNLKVTNNAPSKLLQDWFCEFLLFKDFAMLIDCGVIWNSSQHFVKLFQKQFSTSIPLMKKVTVFLQPSTEGGDGPQSSFLNMFSFEFCLKQIQLDEKTQEMTFKYDNEELDFKKRKILTFNNKNRFISMMEQIEELKKLFHHFGIMIELADQMFEAIQNTIITMNNNPALKSCMDYNNEFLTLGPKKKPIQLKRTIIIMKNFISEYQNSFFENVEKNCSSLLLSSTTTAEEDNIINNNKCNNNEDEEAHKCNNEDEEAHKCNNEDEETDKKCDENEEANNCDKKNEGGVDEYFNEDDVEEVDVSTNDDDVYKLKLNWNNEYQSKSLTIFGTFQNQFEDSVLEDLQLATIDIKFASSKKDYPLNALKCWINANYSGDIWFHYLLTVWNSFTITNKNLLRSSPSSFLQYTACTIIFLYSQIKIEENMFSKSKFTLNENNKYTFTLYQVLVMTKILYIERKQKNQDDICYSKNILFLGYICQNSSVILSKINLNKSDFKKVRNFRSIKKKIYVQHEAKLFVSEICTSIPEDMMSVNHIYDIANKKKDDRLISNKNKILTVSDESYKIKNSRDDDSGDCSKHKDKKRRKLSSSTRHDDNNIQHEQQELIFAQLKNEQSKVEREERMKKRSFSDFDDKKVKQLLLPKKEKKIIIDKEKEENSSIEEKKESVIIDDSSSNIEEEGEYANPNEEKDPNYGNLSVDEKQKFLNQINDLMIEIQSQKLNIEKQDNYINELLTEKNSIQNMYNDLWTLNNFITKSFEDLMLEVETLRLIQGIVDLEEGSTTSKKKEGEKVIKEVGGGGELSEEEASLDKNEPGEPTVVAPEEVALSEKEASSDKKKPEEPTVVSPEATEDLATTLNKKKALLKKQANKRKKKNMFC